MKHKIIEILKRHGAIVDFDGCAVFGSFPEEACAPLRKAKAEIKDLRDEHGNAVRKCVVRSFDLLGLGAVRVCAVHY